LRKFNSNIDQNSLIDFLLSIIVVAL